MGGSLTVYLESQEMEMQRYLERMQELEASGQIWRGAVSESICGKNKVEAGHSRGMWEARKRGWGLPLGVQVILLLRT